MSVELGFYGASRTLKNDVSQMMTSRDYYVTPDLAGDLRKIENAVDHIRLDNDLLRNSGEWRDRFHQPTLNAEKHGAMVAVDRSTGTMFDVKNHVTFRNISNMQDNQAREIHEWAKRNLTAIDKDIGPYAEISVERIRQFCDHVGVTDKYTGYRHNLTRGRRDPVRQGFRWLEGRAPTSPGTQSGHVGPTDRTATRLARSHGIPPTYAVSRPVQVAPPPDLSPPAAPRFTTRQTAGTVRSLNIQYSGTSMERSPPTASIQEQCGINTGFPGRTEYSCRYERPDLDRPTRPFTINPAPDFSIHGRPLMTPRFDPSHTEYQARYEWPDGSRITKLPWLRN